MAYHLPQIEAAGFRVIGTVHDEPITESDKLDVDGIEKIMSASPPWAPDLPLSAEGYAATRYRK
jgi:DNA polymerase